MSHIMKAHAFNLERFKGPGTKHINLKGVNLLQEFPASALLMNSTQKALFSFPEDTH